VFFLEEKDQQKMIQLAKEGKPLVQIYREDFPDYDFWEVFDTIKDAGARGALSVKHEITTKLKKLPSQSKEEQEVVVKELDELVSYLYKGLQDNRKKLNKMRAILGN
jgi:predicted urease superfamily metal-dependent hydrolase